MGPKLKRGLPVANRVVAGPQKPSARISSLGTSRMPSPRLGGGGGGGLTFGSAIVSADIGAEIAAWYAAERAFDRLTEPVDFLGREDSSRCRFTSRA